MPMMELPLRQQDQKKEKITIKSKKSRATNATKQDTLQTNMMKRQLCKHLTYSAKEDRTS